MLHVNFTFTENYGSHIRFQLLLIWIMQVTFFHEKYPCLNNKKYMPSLVLCKISLANGSWRQALNFFFILLCLPTCVLISLVSNFQFIPFKVSSSEFVTFSEDSLSLSYQTCWHFFPSWPWLKRVCSHYRVAHYHRAPSSHTVQQTYILYLYIHDCFQYVIGISSRPIPIREPRHSNQSNPLDISCMFFILLKNLIQFLLCIRITAFQMNFVPGVFLRNSTLAFWRTSYWRLWSLKYVLARLLDFLLDKTYFGSGVEKHRSSHRSTSTEQYNKILVHKETYR